jgi:anti-sigma factor (TIGR02949 family)
MRDTGEVGKIDCEMAERRLHRYLDKELDEEQVAEVQQHLDACGNCRARFRFEAGLRRVVKQTARGETASARLMNRVRRLRRAAGE